MVLAAAAAEWICIAWILVAMGGLALPPVMHLAGPLLLHQLNRRLLVRGRAPASPPRRNLERIYVAVVFTSLFGMLALAANGVLWTGAAAALHVASLAGLPVSSADVLTPAVWTGSALLVGVSALLAHGYGPGQRRVRIVELEAPVRGLDPALDGFRLVQVSDIHLGAFMDAADLAPHVETANSLRGDLICITGDITDGLGHAARTFPELAGLKAPQGVAAVLGNHDVYTGADAVSEALAHYTDFRVLRNDLFAVERGGARLWILGLDDAGLDWARGVREHEALAALVARVPAGEPMVLLSHRPDLFAQAASLSIALVLSGHTHGGQISLPWPSARPASLARFITAYPRGTYALGASRLHVNLGLGVTGQPVRVFSPREIAVITLRCAA